MKKKCISFISKIVFVIIWIIIWQIFSSVKGSSVFFPSPKEVVLALISLVKSGTFYRCLSFSTRNVLLGLIIGQFAAIILAALSHSFSFMEKFLVFPVHIINTVPVAAIVILLLLWCDSTWLSLVISALMVFPIIYRNVLGSLKNTDKKMLEYAKVFRLGFFKKSAYIYLPSILPSLITATCTASCYAWKAGISAEVIGIVKTSIGNALYNSKIYLETPTLFAWIIIIMLLSMIFELVIKAIFLIPLKSFGGSDHEHSFHK